MTLWFYGNVAISVFLVAATALKELVPDPGLTARLLSHLTLSWENNLGAWWSGMLLAVVSLHAFDGYARLRSSEPGAARGWAMLAAVLLFLSLDEVGSLHERLSILGRALSLGSWSLLLPLGGVLGAICLRAMALLWQADGERWKVWYIGAGLFLLSSVALQEFLEHRIPWQSDAAKAIRAAVEEGTELLGTLVLLSVTMTNSANLASRSTGDGRTVFVALDELQRPLAAFGAALAPALAVGTAMLADQQRGRPADWLAAVAFLAAGLVIWGPLLANGRRMARWANWAEGGLCCVASAAVVALSPSKAVHLGAMELSLRMLVLAAVSILVGAACAAARSGRARSHALGTAIVISLAAVAALSSNPMLVYLLSELLGLAVYWVIATSFQTEIAGSRSRSPRTPPGRRP